MTLCIAKSIVDQGGRFSRTDIAHKFYRWNDLGYLSSHGDVSWDVGIATGIACSMWAEIFVDSSESLPQVDQQVANVQRAIYRSKRLNTTDSQGNGSLMRVAPIGLAFHGDLDKAMRYAREQSDLTHPQSACGDACVIYTRLIVECMNSSLSDVRICKTQLARTVANMDISDQVLRERLQGRCAPDSDNYLEQWSRYSEHDVRSTGWVIDTLDVALWALFTTETFADGAFAVVNLGGDSDTAGAVYGGLAGALYGIDSIPQEWRSGILKPDLVESIFFEFIQAIGAGD